MFSFDIRLVISRGVPYRLVTLWASCRRDVVGSFAASCAVGRSGAEFWVSSMA